MRISAATIENDTASRIRERRGGALRPLDQALLHNPDLAEGWNTFVGALRGSGAVPGALRELIVLRIAVLNDAGYEWAAHRPVAEASGITGDQLEAIRQFPPGNDAPEIFSPVEQVVLRLTDASTTEVKVPQDIFDGVLELVGESAAMEICLIVAAYNMVSRFLVAMDLTAQDFPGVAA
jgi:AhpD family alkylhydroperoxidase